ncbi:MAG: LytTR family DNA-binding domain-containing protein, partial [Bacteroidota bacterium]
WIYKRQKKRWYLFNEIGALALGMLMMCFASYLHNAIIVNKLRPTLINGLEYTWYYAFPYFPLMIPLWVFLRSYWGQKNVTPEQIPQPTLLIIGNNKTDQFEIQSNQFIYAKAQQNYVEIFFEDASQQIEKRMIRITLQALQKQIPTAIKVHRSYLININWLKELEGNARKRVLSLKKIDELVPVSQKYYADLQNQLSNSAQNNHIQP